MTPFCSERAVPPYTPRDGNASPPRASPMLKLERTLPYQPTPRSGAGAREMSATLSEQSVQEHMRRNSWERQGGGTWKQMSVSTASTEGMPLNIGNNFGKAFAPSASVERRAFDDVKACARTASPLLKSDGAEPVGVQKAGSHCLPAFQAPSTRTASPAHPPLKSDGAESVGVRKAGSLCLPAFHAPSALAHNSFQLLEKRIEVEVKERMRLWSSLMEDLGQSQATVKRLENKLEDMERMFEEQKGRPHELQDCLNKRCGMLQSQLDTLQRSLEQGSAFLQTERTQTQLQTQISGFAVQLQEVQLANESRNQHLDAAISELQARVLANDMCSALDTRLKAGVEQRKCSKESLAEQPSEPHANSEFWCKALDVNDRCSALEACSNDDMAQLIFSEEGLAEHLCEPQGRMSLSPGSTREAGGQQEGSEERWKRWWKQRQQQRGNSHHQHA